MSEQVVDGERLFDEQQVEGIQMPQVVDVGPGIGGVGVDLQAHVGADEVAHGGHRFDVPTGFDLELDTGVAVVDVALHGGEQRVEGREDPDADTARYPVPSATEALVKGAALGAQFGVEGGHLECRLGHVVALERLEDVGDRRRGQLAGGAHGRHEESGEHQFDGIDELRGVEGFAHGDALAPAPGAVVAGPADEQDLTRGLFSEARPERTDEIEVDAPQFDRFETHVRPAAPLCTTRRG